MALKDVLLRELKSVGLSARHFDKPNAHALVADDDGSLHVLVKEKEGAPLDAMEADVRMGGQQLRLGGQPVVLNVEQGGRIDIDGVGRFRDIVISGFDVVDLSQVQQPLELRVADKDGHFEATVPYSFAVSEVIDRGNVAIRPLEPGKRAGKTFVALDGPTRKLLETTLGRAVDDTVPLAQIEAAQKRARQAMRSHAEANAWLQSLLLSAGEVPGVQLPDVDPPAATGSESTASEAGPLSDDTLAYLESLGVALPEEADLAWAEAALDRLPDDAPETAARELRDVYVLLQEATDAEVAAMFGTPAEGAEPPPSINAGGARLQQGTAFRVAQLEKAVAGLDVAPATLRQLGAAMAEALMPSDKPAVVFVAGPQDSAASRLSELAAAMVSQAPLTVDGREMSDTLATLTGQIRNVPSMSDAALNVRSLSASRDTPARHALVRFDHLESVGAGAGDRQDAVRKELLGLLGDWAESGKAHTFAKSAVGPTFDRQEVPLSNTVLLLHWGGDPAELEQLLRSNATLRALAPKIVEVGTLTAEGAVNALEQDLARALRTRFGQPAAEVRLADELRSAIQDTFERQGVSAVFSRLSDALLGSLADAAQAAPAEAYELTFSRRLTPKERAKVASGEPVPFAERLFDVHAGVPGYMQPLVFTERWEDVVAKSAKVETVDDELSALREQVAALQARNAELEGELGAAQARAEAMRRAFEKAAQSAEPARKAGGSTEPAEGAEKTEAPTTGRRRRPSGT